MTSRLVVNNIDNDTGVTTIRLNPSYSSFELNSAERLRIKSDGKVGVNTDGPSQQFTSYAASGYPILANGPSNGIGLGGNGAIVFGTKDLGSYAKGILDATELEFKISGTPKVNINSSGYVGINTNSPQRSLHVVGTGRPVEIGSDNAVNISKFYTSTTGRSTYNGFDITVNTTNGANLAYYGGYLEFKTSASNGSDATSRLKITSSGNANINKNLGIQTSSVEGSELVGAGTSFFGAYIGDGMLAFHNRLDNSAGYYVAAHVNALNAGPVTLGSTMTLDGTWVIV